MAVNKQSNNNVRYLIIGIALILALLFTLSPPIRGTIAIQFIFLGIAYFIYSTREFQDDTIGLDKKNTISEGFYGILFGVGFIIVFTLFPFFSMAFPRYPGAIADSLRGFLVIGVSPVVETIFFIGAIFAFLRNFNPRSKYLYIILISLFFASFHLGAYILGFYTLSGAEALEAVRSNISAFITAFIFNFVAMSFGLRNGVSKANVVFFWIFHTILNIFAFGLAVITFI